MYKALDSLANKLLPTWLYIRLIGQWDRGGFNKYFQNTSWLFLAKVVSFVTSILMLAIVARYLGPENYGKISYAQSFIALFSIFASLGIDQILYRDLVAHPEKDKILLGTAFISKIIFGTLAFFITTGFAIFLNTDPVLNWIIALMALSFILQPFGVITHFFHAKVLSKYPSYISIVVTLLLPALKLIVIYFDKGIIFFASIFAAEALMYAIGNLYIYKRFLRDSIFSWQLSFSTFISLMQRSWPLILAGLSGYLYARIDQVMIQQILNSRSVGLYDAAVRLTEYLNFVPGIIISSMFPAIINAQKNNSLVYSKRLRSLATLCIAITFLSSLTLFLLAPLLIKLFYGSDFSESILILQVYVWSTIGTISIILIQQYFIAENRPRLFLLYAIFGAVLNILLNLSLIPTFGAIGAAIATLITLLGINIVFFIHKIFFWKPFVAK